MTYDSRYDTIEHIAAVRDNIHDVEVQLHRRGVKHDMSKLESPEKEVFDRITPKLKSVEYASDEYRRVIREELSVGIKHHYENNDHHPEHYKAGIHGMSFLALIEMLCDWKAACDRVGGDFEASLRINKDRFNISDDLMNIIYETCKEMWWI